MERKTVASAPSEQELRASCAIDPTRVRRAIIEQSKRANVGHIGSALSIVEILSCIYANLIDLRPHDPQNRDRFVLSKGHAALALYVVLSECGLIDHTLLDTFCADGSVLGGHPEHALGPIDFTTGSLGQGLTFAVGCALAAKRQRSERKVYVLISDAECNEGSVWEAAMFAAQHKLDNLIVFLDSNGQQALGYTRDVLDQTNVDQRFKCFGWDTQIVDGHNIDALTRAGHAAQQPNGSPHVIVARTTFGNGVSFMHNKIEWHYFPLSDSQYAQAMTELEGK